MAGMLSKVLVATLATVLLIGCAKEPPKCSDEDTFTLIRNIILKQLGGSEGLSEQEIQGNLKIELARATAFDEKIKKYNCEAKLIAGGYYELPIAYESQLDDDGQHVVSVQGITVGDLLGVRAGIIKGIQESRATSHNSETTPTPKEIAAPSDTNCTPQEQVVFSCNIGPKAVSVCATGHLTAADGLMQYRFGQKGSPELVFPDSATHPNKFSNAGTITLSGGGGAYLRLTSGEYGYVVYTASTQEGEVSGLVVEKNGQLVSAKKCIGSVQSILGPEFFESAGLPEDEQGFDLP